jgi:hypothetical protein
VTGSVKNKHSGLEKSLSSWSSFKAKATQVKPKVLQITLEKKEVMRSVTDLGLHRHCDNIEVNRAEESIEELNCISSSMFDDTT